MSNELQIDIIGLIGIFWLMPALGFVLWKVLRSFL